MDFQFKSLVLSECCNKVFSDNKIGLKSWSRLAGLWTIISLNHSKHLALPRVSCNAKFNVWALQLGSEDSLLSKAVFKLGTIMLNQRWCFAECFPPSRSPLIRLRENVTDGDLPEVFQNWDRSQFSDRQSTCSLNLQQNQGIIKLLALKPQFHTRVCENPDNWSGV